MPSKKFLELAELTDQEVISELKETQTQYQKLRFDHAVTGLDNPLVIREIRRDIARLKTEVRRRDLAGMNDAQLAKRSKIRARRRKA